MFDVQQFMCAMRSARCLKLGASELVVRRFVRVSWALKECAVM
jgi:hypothetical protein